MHFVEVHSMEELTCSVTGRYDADLGYFVAALQATAHAINRMIGKPPMRGGKFVPPVKHN